MADSIPITPALIEFWNGTLSTGDFTYENIRQRGGPSQPTLTKLSKGGTISADSARRLEDALGLERGSIRRVAAGGEPRWKPEGGPGDEDKRLGWVDSVTKQWRTVEDLFEGYNMASAYADFCWRSGLSREMYHELNDAIYHAYRALREAERHAAAPEVVQLRPEPDSSDSETSQEQDRWTEREAAYRASEPAGQPEPEQP